MFIHEATRSLLFTAPEPGAILSSMPGREIHGTNFNVAVKHSEAATCVLRDMGYKAPSPICSYYKWPKFKGIYDPFDHQRLMSEFQTLAWRCFNLSEMGTAKTNSALWAADWLMKIGVIKKAMIIAPLSTLERVWLDSIFATLMHRQAAIVHGTREKRLQALAMDVDFYIINHDGLTIGPIREAINKRDDINLVIVDEGSKFRNHDTDKYRCLEKVVGLPNKPVHKRWLWWMTGTPTPNSPVDAWAQARLINPRCSERYKFYGQFRRATMVEIGEHQWKPKHDGYKQAFAIMQPAIRFAKEECLDLPPVTTEDWECDLTPAQRKAFKDMAKEMRTDLANAKEGGTTVTAVNAADKINKQRQILLGSIKVGEGEYETLDAGPRIQTLCEAIDFATAKVYVIVPFKGAIKALERELVKRGYTVGMINGDVPIGKRNRIIHEYKTQDDPQVLLCHPAVVAHGLDFTVADVLALYGPLYSNDEYRQIVERFNRPGQTRKMTIIRIGAAPLEWAIYAMPDAREVTQSSLLKLYTEGMSL